VRAIIRTSDDIRKFANQISDKLTGKPYQIDIRPFKRSRTLPQNAKLHAMIRSLGLHCGYTDSQMKDIVKQEFGTVKVVELGGRIVEVAKPTSEYNVEELAMVIEHLYQLGAEIGCVFGNES